MSTVTVALANALIAAAVAHEQSYDPDSLHEAQNGEEGVVDFDRFYTVSIHQAAVTTAPPELVEPVYLLLSKSWNESLDWAGKVVSDRIGGL